MDLGISRAVNLLTDKLEYWLTTAIELVPNIVAAIIILAVFFGVGWVVRKVVSKSAAKLTQNTAAVGLLETVAGLTVISVGAFIALGVLKLSGAVTTLLAGAGVVGLAVGFAFQESASNFISGVILAFSHPFGVGDIIECAGNYGYVHEITLRNTVIRATQGYLVYMPNKTVLNSPVTNYTWDGARRIDVQCGCSQADDLELVQRVAIETIKGLESCSPEHDVEVFFTEFGESTMDFVIRFWVEFREDVHRHKARSDAIIALRKSFDAHGIATPFPTRTLDFAMQGGAQLHEMLVQADAEIGAKKKDKPAAPSLAPSGGVRPRSETAE